MMGLSKAFDCIPHDLLIAKLSVYGFRNKSWKLIFSYLKGRHQRVKINSEFSSWKEIIDGVPQGSLSVADTNINTILSKLETDIQNLSSWSKANGMLLNGDKCQFLLIESSRTMRNHTSEIEIGDKYVEESRKGKLIGINFDNNLTMVDHIKYIFIQASSKLHALARISHFLNEHKRKLLMKSFIISQFNYCPIIWMYCQRKFNTLINRIHERSLKIAYTDYESDFNSLLE